MNRAGTYGLLLLASLLAGCGNYQSRWEAARAATKPSDPYAGAWEGTWKSERHAGEGDTLQCILTPVPGSPGSYHADFKARWLKVVTSTHDVVLHLKEKREKKAGAQSFTGSAKLSALLGSGDYRCDGTITPTHLTARYDAKYDTGIFFLERRLAAGNR